MTTSTNRVLASTVPNNNKKMKVTVVGGTHGNEYTGVWCIKSLDRRLKSSSSSSAEKEDLFPNLDISTLLGNPAAFEQNKRFVEEDLNRQFSYAARVESPSQSVESKRAIEINELLGPKNFDDDICSTSSTEKNDDSVVIDLHTTTTNMGITIIVGQGDPLMTQCAAYMVQKCSSSDDDENKNNNVCVLIHTHKNQKARPHVASIGHHALTIEVGPVPQGVLRHDVVEKTQKALEVALEFLQRHRTEPKEVLQEELKTYFPTGQVPCYRSAPGKRKGEISCKISWPCDAENPNFPSWMVHKSIQDQDFKEVKTGDPLFIDLDGKTIAYDGSHGSPIILMFINEGGYYYSSSGTGISIALRDKYSLETGKLIVEE